MIVVRNFLIGILPTIAISALIQFVRYRRSIHKTVEPFSSYLIGPLRYNALRWLRHASKAQFNLRKYCRHQLKVRALDLIVPGVPPRPLPIETSYIPSGLLRSSGASVAHSDLAEGTIQRAQIIGEPGSGKTSLVKRVFRDACASGMRSPRTARLPVLIDLKELEVPSERSERGQFLLKQVAARVGGVEGFEMSEFFKIYSTGPGVLVLLDGLDEVPADRLTGMMQCLVELSGLLAAASPRNVLLVTMRSQLFVHVGDQLQPTFVETVTLQPFTSGEIYNFLGRWDFQTGTNATQVAQMYDYLTDQPSLREMCSNPLVLAMYVLDHDRGSSVAPETRAEFYRQVLNELLIYRRNRQVDLGPGLSSLREQRETLLGRIALEHLTDMSEPANSISYERAKQIVKEEMSISQDDLADQFLLRLSLDTGLFSMERERETIRFMHLTFCEYFAALQAVDGGEEFWRDLLGSLTAAQQSTDVETRLAEAIVFSAALVPRGYRSSLFEVLHKTISRSVLLRCYIESRFYQDANLTETIFAEADALSKTPYALRNEAWIRAVRSMSALLRDMERISPVVRNTIPLTLNMFLTNLIGGNPANFEHLFGMYMREDPVGALRMAAAYGVNVPSSHPEWIVQTADEPSVLAICIGEASKDGSQSSDWQIILAEAALAQRVVADELNRLAPSASLQHILPRVRGRYDWNRCWLTKGTLYGQILTIASTLVSAEPSKFTFRRIGLLTQIRPRRLMITEFLGSMPPISPVGSLVLILAAISLPPIREQPVVWILLAMAGVLVVGLLINYLLYRHNADRQRTGSRAVVNLIDRTRLFPRGGVRIVYGESVHFSVGFWPLRIPDSRRAAIAIAMQSPNLILVDSRKDWSIYRKLSR